MRCTPDTSSYHTGQIPIQSLHPSLFQLGIDNLLPNKLRISLQFPKYVRKSVKNLILFGYHGKAWSGGETFYTSISLLMPDSGSNLWRSCPSSRLYTREETAGSNLYPTAWLSASNQFSSSISAFSISYSFICTIPYRFHKCRRMERRQEDKPPYWREGKQKG